MRQLTEERNPRPRATKRSCCWISLKCLSLDVLILSHSSAIHCSAYSAHHSSDEKLYTKAGQRIEYFSQRVLPGAHIFPQPLLVHIFCPCRFCSSTEHHCLFISKLVSLFFLPQILAHRTRASTVNKFS